MSYENSTYNKTVFLFVLHIFSPNKPFFILSTIHFIFIVCPVLTKQAARNNKKFPINDIYIPYCFNFYCFWFSTSKATFAYFRGVGTVSLPCAGGTFGGFSSSPLTTFPPPGAGQETPPAPSCVTTNWMLHPYLEIGCPDMKKDSAFKIIKFVIVFAGVFILLLFPFLYHDRAVYNFIVWLYAIVVTVLGVLKAIINKENITRRLLMSMITLAGI